MCFRVDGLYRTKEKARQTETETERHTHTHTHTHTNVSLAYSSIVCRLAFRKDHVDIPVSGGGVGPSFTRSGQAATFSSVRERAVSGSAPAGRG